MKTDSVMEWSEPGGAQMRISWGQGVCRKREIWAADSIAVLCVCVRVCICVTSEPQWCWESFNLQGLFLEHQTPCSTVRGQEATKYVVTRFSENLLELSLYWLETISMLRLDSKTFSCWNLCLNVVGNLSIWWGCSSIPLQVGKKSAVISLCSHLWSPWMHPWTCHHKPSFIIVISYARCFLPS